MVGRAPPRRQVPNSQRARGRPLRPQARVWPLPSPRGGELRGGLPTTLQAVSSSQEQEEVLEEEEKEQVEAEAEEEQKGRSTGTPG